MKQFFKLMIVPFLVLFLFAGNALAMNITIYDGNGYSGSGQGGEDNETEPGMVNTQIWDLEAFLLEGTTLTMVGGYNFKEGEVGNGHTFKSGDIFIGRNVSYGIDAAVKSTGTSADDKMTNVFGYEFAIDLDFVNNKFYVYEINSNTEVTTSFYYNYVAPDYRSNQASNPVSLSEPSTSSSSYQGDLGFGKIDEKFYASVDIGFLLGEGWAGQEFFTHFTMECGNDNLMGKGTTSVPEPATLLLLGTGLLGLAGVSRKKFKK